MIYSAKAGVDVDLEVAAVADVIGGRKFMPFEGDRIKRNMLAKAGSGRWRRIADERGSGGVAAFGGSVWW